MPTITTSRNILKFYVTIIFGFIFFSALGGFMIYMGIDPAQRADFRRGGEYIMPAFGALVIFVAFYTVYRYFKNSPIISVDHDRICFNNKEYDWKDINDIVLTGKQPFRYIIGFSMECAQFTFNDGSVICMFDDMYTNAWQVKLFIQEVVIDKGNAFQLPDIKISSTEMQGDDFETFKGSSLLSFRGLTCWVLIGFLAFLMLGVDSITPRLLLCAFILIWLRFHAWLMHYFRVSQNFFVVKDHITFWQNTAYRLSDVKEIVFETRDKQPNCLRIITKDFRSKLYPASTLRDKTWLQIKEKLETCGVKVRNECIPDNRS